MKKFFQIVFILGFVLLPSALLAMTGEELLKLVDDNMLYSILLPDGTVRPAFNAIATMPKN